MAMPTTDSATYVLNNFLDLSEEIDRPLKQTQRIRYTCFDASANYIVFGATSGSVYIFQREQCKFLQLIQNMYGSVSHVAISPQEKFIGFSTTRGTICVYVIKLNASYPQIVATHYEDSNVLCLHWKRNEEQLFYGDAKGNVYLVNLTSFLGRNLTHISIHPILFLDAPIVQIADFNQFLLISNYEKCILCNVEAEEFKQIGNKPRNGYYGACFLSSNVKESTETKIMCARPGSRLWTVDLDGNVLQTSQFKGALSCPPMQIFNKNSLKFESNISVAQNTSNALLNGENQHQQQLSTMLQLRKLQPLFGRYIFGYTKDGFYIFDPSKSDMILWNDQFRDIQNIKVVSKNCLVIFTNTNKLYQLNVQSLEEVFVQLFEQKEYQNCITLIRNHKKYFQVILSAPLYVLYLVKLRQNLQLNGDIKSMEELEEIFSHLSLNENEHITDQQRHHSQQKEFTEPTVTDQSNDRYRNFEENIKSVILSTISEKITKNLLNKFYFFNETENEQNVNGNTQSQHRHPVIVNRMPNQNRIVNEIVHNNQQDVNNDQNDIVCSRNAQSQYHQRPVSIPGLAAISAEEKLLQNLFMVYRSSQMSKMTLVERYGYIFDQYDCAGIAELLGKLELIMIENGETDAEAKRHCLQMYFNYLNPELIWELDNESREFIINGFILVNTTETTEDKHNSTIHCQKCNFPILINRSIELKHKELGNVICKYLWSRQQHDKCFAITIAVPPTLLFICQFLMQEERELEKLLRFLFACDNDQLFGELIRKSCFDQSLWIKTFDIMSELHEQRRFSCGNCNSLNGLPKIGTKLHVWQVLLDHLVQTVNGQTALTFVQRYAKYISGDTVKKDFFLKCLLNP